jgi:shikimate kinase
MHVYLIGYRGAGKSTVGAALAHRLGRDWIDTDQRIEQQAGRTIKTIFETDGEQAFRDLESAVITELAAEAQTRPQVVSLGGGAVLRAANRQVLAASGRRIWLTARPEVLFERITQDGTSGDRRPALSGLGAYDEVAALLAAREPLYRELAEKTVDTERLTTEDIAEQIARWLAA